MKFLVEILINASGEPAIKAVDGVGTAFERSSKRVDATSVRSEAAIRRTAEAAEKLKDQLAETKAAKGLIADMTGLNAKLDAQLAAWRKGPEAIAQYTRETKEAAEAQRILAAQVRAGVSADSAQGKEIAEKIRLHNRLQVELDETMKKELARRGATITGGGTDHASALLGGIAGLTGGGGPLISGAQNLLFFKSALDGIKAGGGNAAAGITATVTSLGPYLPLVAAAAAGTLALGAAFKVFDYLKGVIVEGTQTQIVVEQLNNALRSNGSFSGLSAAGMIKLAESLALLSGQSDDAIIAGELIASRYENIGRDVFPRVATAAVNMSRALPGKSVEESFTTISRVVNGGAGALKGLKDAGIALLPSQKKYLEQLQEQGKVTEYQNIVLTLLEKKLGNAAEAFGNTLPGAVERGRFVVGEFGEEIASEVIPALETFLSEVARSAGGWKTMLDAATDAGAGIGNSIRLMVYGAMIQFREIQLGLDHIAIAWYKTLQGMSEAALGFVEGALRLMSRLPDSMGGEAFGKAADALKQRGDDVGYYDKKIAEANQSAKEHEASLARIVIALREHRRALDGDTEATKGNGDEVDKLGKSVKQTADYMAEWDKIIYSLGTKLQDQLGDLVKRMAAQDALQAALRKGVVAYEQERQAQERAAVVSQELTKADQAYRTELEKLLAVIEKMKSAGQAEEANKKAAELQALKDGYATYRVEVEKAAGAVFDKTKATAHEKQVTDEAAASNAAFLRVQAELQDLISGTTVATRNLTRAQALRTAELNAAKTGDEEAIDRAILATDAAYDRIEAEQALLAIERARRDAKLDVADAQNAFDDWTEQREAALKYGETVAGILDQYDLLSDAAHKRGIEERVAQAIAAGASKEQANALRAELTAQQAIIDGIHRMQAEMVLAERWYRDLADQLAGNFGRIFDDFLATGKVKLDDFGDAIKDSLRSTLSAIVQEWLNKWFQAMAAWLARWIATQAAAKGASAALGTGGGTGGASALMGMGSQAMGAGAGGAGGGWLTNAFIGNPMTGGMGTLGAAAIWAAVVAIAFNQIKTSGRSHVRSDIEIGGGGLDVGMGSQNGNSGKNWMKTLAAAEGIIKVVNEFVRSMGADFDSLATATSRVSVGKTGQGSKANWYVTYGQGLVENFGKDAEAAMEFAVIQAIKQSPLIGLSPEVAAAIKNSTAKGLEEFQKDIDLAMSFVRDRLGDVGSQAYDTIKSFYDRVAKAASLGIEVDPDTLTKQVDQIRDGLLGINTAVADFLADLLGFQQGVDEGTQAMRAKIENSIKAALDKIAELEASGPRTFEGRDGVIRTQTDEEWKRQIQNLKDAVARYQEELAKIPKALTDQEISMGIFNSLYEYLKGSGKYAEQAHKYALLKVELEFAAIKAQLIALGRWEEFATMFNDAYAQAKKDAGKPGGGGGKNRGQTREDLRDEIGGLRAEAAGPLHSAFYEFQKGVEDFTKKAKDAKLPAKELAEGVALLTEQFRRSVRDQANTFAGVGTDFTKRLAAMQAFFAETRELGPEATGLSQEETNGLEQTSLARFGSEIANAVSQFSGLVNPMLAINRQAGELRENVRAYGEAVGWTADQIAEAEAQISAGVEFQRTQAVNSIFGTLFSYLQQDAAYQAQYAEFRRAEIDLQFRLIEAQLRALDVWDESTQRIFNAARAAADAQADAVPDIDTSYASLSSTGTDVFDDFAQAFERIQDQLAAWNRVPLGELTQQADEMMVSFDKFMADAVKLLPTGWDFRTLAGDAFGKAKAGFISGIFKSVEDEVEESPLVRRLGEITTRFDDIYGALSRIGAAHTDLEKSELLRLKHVQAALDEWLEPINSYLSESKFGSLSTLTGADQFSAARDEFRQTASKLLGGDLSITAGEVVAAGERFRELGRAFTAGQGYRFLDKEITDTLNSIKTNLPALVGPLSGVALGMASNPMVASSPDVVASLSSVTSAVNVGNELLLEQLRSGVQEMRAHTSQLDNIARSLADQLSVRLVA